MYPVRIDLSYGLTSGFSPLLCARILFYGSFVSFSLSEFSHFLLQLNSSIKPNLKRSHRFILFKAPLALERVDLIQWKRSRGCCASVLGLGGLGGDTGLSPKEYSMVRVHLHSFKCQIGLNFSSNYERTIGITSLCSHLA